MPGIVVTELICVKSFRISSYPSLLLACSVLPEYLLRILPTSGHS